MTPHENFVFAGAPSRSGGGRREKRSGKSTTVILVTLAVMVIIITAGWYTYTHNWWIIHHRFRSAVADFVAVYTAGDGFLTQFDGSMVTYDYLSPDDDPALEGIFGGSHGWRRHVLSSRIGDGRYDIIRTDSIVTPYIGTYSFTVNEQITAFSDSESSAHGNNTIVYEQTRDYELTFHYRDNRWEYEGLSERAATEQ